MNIQKQLRRMNVFGFVSCLRVFDAVWVVLLTLRGFPLWQIGLAEGIFHIVSLVCEIPSGMAADLLGRRRSLALAGLLGAVSAWCMVLSEGFFGVCLSMAFGALSYNFISGSDEALLYDSLLQAGREGEYVPANARYTQMQNVGGFLSHAASLLTGLFGYVGIYLLDSGICLARALSALSLTEPTVTRQQENRQRQPFRALGRRFRAHVGEVAAFFRRHPRAVYIMLADGLIGLPSYLTLMFLQQRLHELGVATVFLGAPAMCIVLARSLGLSIGQRLSVGRIWRLYGVCAAIMGLGTVLAGSAALLPAVLGAMAASGALDAWMLHLQKHLNGLFPSDQRATLVSVNAMGYSLLMIAASPLVGWLGDVGPTAGTGLTALGGLVAAVGMAVLLFKKK